MSIKIATWNVNSIKARLPLVKRWLERHSPDILMMQELKGTEFPQAEFAALGYQSAFVAQKAYNGVAILSKTPVSAVCERLDGEAADDHARYLEADISGLRFICIYLPNGNPPDTDKFTYKLSWMGRLQDRIDRLRQDRVPFIAGGDFNVIPEGKDCYDPVLWSADALFRTETRQRYRALVNLGLTDAFRVFNAEPRQYTFYDYQAGAWQKGNGIRIDHFLLSPPAADRLLSCEIDTEPRGWDQPSDHVPLIMEIAS